MTEKLPWSRLSPNHTYCSWLLLCLAFILIFPSFTKAQEIQRYQFEHPQMGTLFKIILYAPDQAAARAAVDSAFQRIDALNAILSDYLPTSELNKLSAASGSGNFIPVSEELYRVIYEAQALSKQTDGAFDITIGAYVELWREMNRRPQKSGIRLPDPSTLKEAGKSVGFQQIRLDTMEKRVALMQPGIRLDLGGIAKGYAADETLKVLQSFGIETALVDAGGDITAGEAPPGKVGWTITIPYQTGDDKMNTITYTLSNRAIATSGDLFQYVEIDGERYSHIINPHTGLGLTNRSMVTVVAPDGITADSYASALSVLGPETGIDFIESRPEIVARFVYRENGTFKILESSGFEVERGNR